MTVRLWLVLLALSAIWGASFLFMRVAAPEFGPLPLILVRTGGAALCLLPLLLARGQRELVWRHRGKLALSGLLNAALPFSLLAWAMLQLQAGFASLLNATVPFFTALVAAIWLGVPLKKRQAAGLALGFAGVLLLAWDRLSFKPGGSGWSILAALGAACSYGLALNFVKKHLSELSSTVVAAGSLSWAGLFLLPLGWWRWPSAPISLGAWECALGLAVACTAVAFYVFFKIVIRAGPLAASLVTFLVPCFGILWGWLFLEEKLTWNMLAGMAVTLMGTALVMGLLDGFRRGEAD